MNHWDEFNTMVNILTGCCGALALCLLGFLGFVLIDALRQHFRGKFEHKAYYKGTARYIIREAEAEWAERQKHP